MLVTMSSETGSFPGGRKIRNESDESAADSASFRIVVSSCKQYTSFPEFNKIIDNWSEVMVECCKWWFSWSRYNTSKEHVLRLVS